MGVVNIALNLKNVNVYFAYWTILLNAFLSNFKSSMMTSFLNKEIACMHFDNNTLIYCKNIIIIMMINFLFMLKLTMHRWHRLISSHWQWGLAGSISASMQILSRERQKIGKFCKIDKLSRSFNNCVNFHYCRYEITIHSNTSTMTFTRICCHQKSIISSSKTFWLCYQYEIKWDDVFCCWNLEVSRLLSLCTLMTF